MYFALIVFFATVGAGSGDYGRKYSEAVDADAAKALATIQATETDAFDRFYGVGQAHQALGDYPAAKASFLRAAAVARGRNEPGPEGAAYIMVGITQGMAGDLLDAERAFHRAVRLGRAAGDERLLYNGLDNLGQVRMTLNDAAGATRFSEEAAKRAEAYRAATGDPRTIYDLAGTYYNLANSYLALGRDAQVDQSLAKGLPFARLAKESIILPLYQTLIGRRERERGLLRQSEATLLNAYREAGNLPLGEYRFTIYYHYARTLGDLGEVDEMEAVVRRLTDELDAMASKPEGFLSKAQEIRGLWLQEAGRPEEAAMAFRKAYSLANSFNTTEKAAELGRLESAFQLERKSSEVRVLALERFPGFLNR